MALPEYTAYSTEGKRKLPPNLNPLRPIAASWGITLKPAEPDWSIGAPASLGARPPVIGAQPAPISDVPQEPVVEDTRTMGQQRAEMAQRLPASAAPAGDYIDRGFGQPREVALSKYAIGGTTEGVGVYDPAAQLARLREIDPEKYGAAGGVAAVAPVRPNVSQMTLGGAAQAKGQFAADQASYLQGQELAGQRRGQDVQAQGQRLQYGVGMAGVGERRYATDVGAETAAQRLGGELRGQDLTYAGTIAGHAQRQQEAEARHAQEAAKAAWEQTKFGQTLQAGPEELVLNPSTGMMEPRKQYFTPSMQGLVKFGGGSKPAPSQSDIEHTAKLRGMTVEEVKAKLGLK